MSYADTNVVIRLVEGDAAARSPLETKLNVWRNAGSFLLTSRLTRLECRVKPLRENDTELLAIYDAFFDSPELSILEISAAIVGKATEIRAGLYIRTPDAIRLASAIVAGTNSFLTGDKALAKCSEANVEVV